MYSNIQKHPVIKRKRRGRQYILAVEVGAAHAKWGLHQPALFIAFLVYEWAPIISPPFQLLAVV
jgi:hypothetical protein